MSDYFPLSSIPTNSEPGSDWVTCGICGKSFPDIYPSGRCPFESEHETTITLYYNEDIRDEDSPINTESDMEIAFRDFLDETYPEAEVCGILYGAAHTLERVDPIAYRQGFLDYCDTWEEIEVPAYIYFTDQEREYIVSRIDGTEFVEESEDGFLANDGTVFSTAHEARDHNIETD